MCFLKGAWRLDIFVMFLYQMTLFFSVQMLFVIFLEYMPTTYCDKENFCYKMKGKCLTAYDRNQSTLCPLDAENFETCVADAKRVDFHSAQFDYQQDCTSLVHFSASTVTFIGTLLGNIVLGYLSDKIGRRPVYIVSVAMGVPSLVLSAAIPGIAPYYTFRLLTGFAVAGTLTVGWTYGSEIISPARRLRLRTFPNWANARMMQVGVAYVSGEWRMASYICAALSMTILPMIWYLPESPVFLEQKKQFEKAEKARMKIAKMCNVPYEKKPMSEVRTLKKITPWMVLKNPVLRRNFLILCFMWFYVGMTIYITDLNGGDMSKNFYVGQFFSGLILTVSKIIIGSVEPFLPWFGRRVLFLVSQLVALIAYALILIALYTNNKMTTWYTISYMIAYAAQSLCLETCYLSLAELMPTDVRTTAGAITNILMKIGTILASTTKQLKYTYEPGLFWINIIICSVGFVVIFFYLQESKNVNIQTVGQDNISSEEEESNEKSKNESAVEAQLSFAEDDGSKTDSTVAPETGTDTSNISTRTITEVTKKEEEIAENAEQKSKII